MKVAFGTSGVRGKAAEFTDAICFAFVRAFLDHLLERGVPAGTLAIAIDRRPSSPQIAAGCIAAAKDAGWQVDYLGLIPTPALALHAITHAMPGLMVTGSHNPASDNGLKFYRPDGEMTKTDEGPVLQRATGYLTSRSAPPVPDELPLPNATAEIAYKRRFTDLFGERALHGWRIGIDQHSAVGRDLLREVIEALGAKTVIIRRSESFVAMDTEAVDAADMTRARKWIANEDLQAIVSTDGDGDRPLVIDDKARQIGGDTLGAIVARALGFADIVTPVSSISTLESARLFKTVWRTRIGSPYVIAAMQGRFEQSGAPVAGFEPNGGFLTLGDIKAFRGTLTSLPTRDAMLPLLMVMVHAHRRNLSLSQLVALLPSRTKFSGRLTAIDRAAADAWIKALVLSEDARGEALSALRHVADIDLRDGARFLLRNGDVVHYRLSGNADELRCYVESGTADAAKALLNRALDAARASQA